MGGEKVDGTNSRRPEQDSHLTRSNLNDEWQDSDGVRKQDARS